MTLAEITPEQAATNLAALATATAEAAAGHRAARNRYRTTSNTPRTTSLTPAQRHLVALIADGHTDTSIARTLGLGLDAAKYRIGRLIATTGTANRTHLVATALRRGWIT